MKYCKAAIWIKDDYGENMATMRCELEQNHEDMHKKEYTRAMLDGKTAKVAISWQGNDETE